MKHADFHLDGALHQHPDRRHLPGADRRARSLLALDRYVGTNFFTNGLGGNPMMYVNLASGSGGTRKSTSSSCRLSASSRK